jgi:hypothetical protein
MNFRKICLQAAAHLFRGQNACLRCAVGSGAAPSALVSHGPVPPMKKQGDVVFSGKVAGLVAKG